ncbi:MAG: DUF2062 domain-containing protein [Leptolyngbya sp.]|nr:DUF2062 domain-containing protein [Leptolyngbya sp.]
MNLPASPPVPRPRSRSLAERWRRRFRYFYLRFVRLRGHPKELARGLAAGVFAGLFPLFGLQTILGVAIALRIRGNPILAAAGTWVSNPFTYVPIYAFNYQLGRWLLGSNQTAVFDSAESYDQWLAMGTEVALTLFLGCFIMGILGAALTYGLGLPLITRLQSRYRRLKRP